MLKRDGTDRCLLAKAKPGRTLLPFELRPALRMAPILAGLFSTIFVIATGVLSTAAHADGEVSAEDTVNALNGVFGRHAKQRGSHAKGFCVAGTFAATPEGQGFSSSSLFGSAPVKVTARFSTGGGNPKAADTKRAVRGLGARFHLPDDEELDLVMITAPTFFASNPAQFVEFLKVRTGDPATGQKNKAAIAAWNAENPNALAHLKHVSQTPPPASYATALYFSTHAFRFSNADKPATAARWIFEPAAGVKGLSADQEKSFPANFLQQELSDRLKTGSAKWNVFVKVAGIGDSLVDPSSAWGDDNRKVLVGHMQIDRMIARGASDDCVGFVFDPNNLPTGIEPTRDPILAIRSPAYAVSLSRREAE